MARCTEGGQNSFMESMANGVPLVVVPGFADQPVNGRKAEAIAATARGSETAAASATAPRKSYGDMFREMSAQAEAEASK